MTARIERYRNLRTIRTITGRYNRHLTHSGSRNFLESYKYDRELGYPVPVAIDRANDVAYAVMRHSS